MKLQDVYGKSMLIKRKDWDNFGSVFYAGSAILFKYSKGSITHTAGITLDDVLAEDWELNNESEQE